MQRHCPRNRTHWIMWSDTHMGSLGYGRDLPATGKATAMSEVRLYIGHCALLCDVSELARGKQAFAGGKRAVDTSCQVGHGGSVAWLDRFFDEERTNRGDDVDVSFRCLKDVG